MSIINVVPLRASFNPDPELLDLERANYLCELSALSGYQLLINHPSSLTIFLIETGGTEEAFSNLFRNYPEPYFILTTSMRNSLPASLEIGAFLGSQNKSFYLLHGTAHKVATSIRDLVHKYDQ